MCGVYMYSSATYSYVSLQVVKVKACGVNVPSTRTSTVLTHTNGTFLIFNSSNLVFKVHIHIYD